jgi:diguanylate cyclase (GGDEF)-like protein
MTPPRSDGQSGSALLRRLQILRVLYGVVVVGLMVVGGDFVYPRLDRRIGRIDTDIIESVVLSLLLYVVTLPAFRALGRSIRELDELQRRFRSEAIHDPLSGVFNRRHFDERLIEESERARRYGTPLSLIAIDVDLFKAINDELGHAAGDAAIQEIGRRLQHRRRRGDVLARMGGDEFTVLLPNVALDGALSLAEEIRSIFAHEPMLLPSAAGQVSRIITVSCGVSELRGDDKLDFELVRRADALMYEAKERRNFVVSR